MVNRRKDVLLKLGVFLGALYILIMLVRSFAAQRQCLAHGYRDIKVDVVLTAYCVRRTDQSDVVVRLDSLQRGARP